MGEDDRSGPDATLDAQTRAVRDDYEGQVGRWEGIYRGASFHDHAIRRRLERSLALVDRLHPRPAGVGALDVGCGAGQLLVALARRGFSVTGVDVAGGMVAASRERLRGAGLVGEVRVAAADALPLRDGAAELVTALGVIEYLPDRAAGVAEMARVLAPGGHLVVTSPNPVRLAFLADPAGVLRGVAARRSAPYPRRYATPRRLRRLLEGAGLRVVHLEGHGLGPPTLAGVPVLPAGAAVRLGTALERALPAPACRWLGANLIAVARRAPTPDPDPHPPARSTSSR